MSISAQEKPLYILERFRNNRHTMPTKIIFTPPQIPFSHEEAEEEMEKIHQTHPKFSDDQLINEAYKKLNLHREIQKKEIILNAVRKEIMLMPSLKKGLNNVELDKISEPIPAPEDSPTSSEPSSPRSNT